MPHQRRASHSLPELRAWLVRQLEGHAPLPVPRDDLVDDVILRFLVASESRRIESPFAYARTILLNVIRDHIRALERARKMLEALAERARSGDGGAGGGDAVGNEDLVAFLLEHSSLSPLQRKIVEMVYFNGMSITEVSRELSRNPGTIQQHHSRGIGKMARCAAALGVDR